MDVTDRQVERAAVQAVVPAVLPEAGAGGIVQEHPHGREICRTGRRVRPDLAVAGQVDDPTDTVRAQRGSTGRAQAAEAARADERHPGR